MRQEPRTADDRAGADYVEFWSAGESVKGEFHCAECGYGVTIYRELPMCPMCAGNVWEQAAWSPFFATGRTGSAPGARS